MLSSLIVNGQEDKISYQSIDWMPSSNQIVFTAIKVKTDWSDYSPDNWHLYRYDLESRELTDLGNSIIYFSISTDGKQIVYDKNSESGKDIFILNLETGKSQALVASPTKDAGPSWSGDGKNIVFYSDRDGNEELYKMELQSGQISQLTFRDEYGSYNPQWSPDSNLIVYYLEKGDSKDQIYLTDSAGTVQQNLTNDNHHNIFPSWTPDGRILYIRDKGEIMIMNSDGTGKEPLLVDQKAGLIKMDKTGKKALMTDGKSNLHILYLDDLSSEIVINIDMLK